MMFPFTMVCDECQEYNYTGTKFTAKVEMIKGESYLGLKVYRFYGRCRHCWAEFTFKTDPKNSDYTMESGGKRTYEAWKDADMMETELKKEREKDAEQDQMKALEQKSVDVQAEMQRVEDLDAIRTLNKRLGYREKSIDEALDFLFQREAERKAQEEDNLEEADMLDLAGFRKEREERKRQQLDAEVEGTSALQDVEVGVRSTPAGLSAAAIAATKKTPGGDSASAFSTSAGSAGSASGATSAGEAPVPLSVPQGAANASAARTAAPGATSVAAAVAAAVAERASSQAAGRFSGVGARFAVKRKALTGSSVSNGEPSLDEEAGKRPRFGVAATESSAKEGAGSEARSTAPAALASDGCIVGALGALGAYDSGSDSS